MHAMLLYLRTKLAIEHDDQTISELAEAFPFQAMRSVIIPKRYVRDPPSGGSRYLGHFRQPQ